MRYNISDNDKNWADDTFNKLKAKMAVQRDRIGCMLPFVVRDKKYMEINFPGKATFWTNGFWPGILWQMYNATQDKAYKEVAEACEVHLEEAMRIFDGLHHDVGFMYLLSAIANYKITNNKDSYTRGLHAATLLAGRFNINGEFIRAWNDSPKPGEEDNRGWMIIDCLLNIPILHWATSETNDPRFAEIANRHARTAQKYIVRPDGSCNHIVNLNPETGEFVNLPMSQGYGPDSWSRGQAWAVYGFAASYHHTKNIEFLDTAKKCAHYCISSMAGTDWVPLCDFRSPKEPLKHDTAAGMIIACGLLEISEHVHEFEKKMYVDAALKILRACDEKYGNWNVDEDSIMGGGSLRYHNDNFPDAAVIYNDYFYVEAILRLVDKDIYLW